MKSKKKLMSEFECSDEGELNEYVGCKIIKNTSEKWLKFTQPVLTQSFKDEFDTTELNDYATPMEAGKFLTKAEPRENLESKV